MSSLKKKTKAKFLQFPAILSRKTSRSPSPNPDALPESSTAGIPNDAPGGEDDQRSQGNLLSAQSTVVASYPVVENSIPVPSHPSESSPQTSGQIKKGLGVAWIGLGTALRLLERSADALPPLKTAAGGLVALLDLGEAVTENNEEYEKLATELTSIVNVITPHIPALVAGGVSSSVVRIVESINAELKHMEKQRGRNIAMRTVTAFQDQGDVLKCYRTIESLFRQLQSDITLRTWDAVRKLTETGLLKDMSPVYEALYNSDYSTTIKRGRCTAKTREKVLGDLKGWAGNPGEAKICWMNGMAGTGKTTISYTLCEWLKNNNQLGANYFCSRASDLCRNVNKILPTLAHQLAKYSHSFRSTLCKVLEEEPESCRLDIASQFRNLIQMPLQAIEAAMPDNVVIVIDALDECDDEVAFRLFLDTLLKLAVNLPIKFFITSRPEPAIRGKMLASEYSKLILYLHDIEASIVGADIGKYLTEALRSMTPVPSSNEVERLVEASGKLFIYAATAVRFICPGDSDVDGNTRLQTVLGMVPGSTDQYDDLNALYTNILHTALYPPNRHRVKGEIYNILLVLKTVVCAKEPMTTQALASLLSLTEERVRFAVQPLQSVLHMHGAVETLIAPFHSSFPDFLFDECRSKEFYCKTALHNELLANHCFDLMKKELRFNICDLESSFVFDADVRDLPERIKTSISPALSYTCRYWGEHLLQGSLSNIVHDKLVNFLAHRFLFWIEVLSLSRCIRGHGEILERINMWLSDWGRYSATMEKLADAKEFIIKLNDIQSTPHIYISGLAFCPRSSFVYHNYWEHTKGLVELNEWGSPFMGCINSVAVFSEDSDIASGSVDDTIRVWDAHNGNMVAGPFHGHTDSVLSVVFSPNGTKIASGSTDNTIRVWDTRNGNTVAGPFVGHTASVRSVAFSPDGTRIASGSVDDTIRVWDAHNGNMVAGPFHGHTNSVLSVAFSPNGTKIASGSTDNTIRVWDAHNGNMVARPFVGQKNSVFSVAFSPDGTRVASSSVDDIIRVWDARNGNMVAGSFEGHTGWVQSVAFSPDGTQIASGSVDNTIRVWDAHNGNMVAGPFEGHTSWVQSVAFSPDGTQIASGSTDSTIRVWDTRNGNTVAGPFVGHTASVRSVAFSPDGTRIASGSVDDTIRVWDAHNQHMVPDSFHGHTASVRSVAFSPNGTCIASGSADNTIRVWDAHNGNTVAGPFHGHTDSVQSVAFSPNDTKIASGSADNTIRVWDAQNGNMVAGPFYGHTALVWSVAFSLDGTKIASGSADETIRVWDAHNGNMVAGPFYGHTDSVQSVAFSPNGTKIASGSADNTIRVWDARNGNMVAGPFEGHTDSVRSVAFSPDGKQIASGSSDYTIRVWDAHNGNMVAGPFYGHTDSVLSVAFSPNGTQIASGSADNTIQVWNVYNGDMVAGPFDGHTDSVFSVTFSFDGTRIVSGSHDGTIRLWDAHSGLLNSIPGCATLNHSLFSGHVLGEVPVKQFTLYADGWITTNNHLLFWVPYQFRNVLLYAGNTLAITPRGIVSNTSVTVDLSKLYIGETWSKCYHRIMSPLP